MSNTTCPKCGYTRKNEELAPDYECPQCGIVYAKFKKATPKEDPITEAPKAPTPEPPPIDSQKKRKMSTSFKVILVFIGLVVANSFSTANNQATRQPVESTEPPLQKEAHLEPTLPEPIELKSRNEFSADSQQICYKKWNKRGELDSRMYNYCMEQQEKGYEKLLYQNRYADQSFYSGTSFPYCHQRWTKRGVSDARMMAHCLEQEIEGIQDVMYYREQYGEERVNKIVATALYRFHSWNMAAYKVKRTFE